MLKGVKIKLWLVRWKIKYDPNDFLLTLVSDCILLFDGCQIMQIFINTPCIYLVYVDTEVVSG